MESWKAGFGREWVEWFSQRIRRGDVGARDLGVNGSEGHVTRQVQFQGKKRKRRNILIK